MLPEQLLCAGCLAVLASPVSSIDKQALYKRRLNLLVTDLGLAMVNLF
jgi:hypothetical protein